MWVHMSKQKFIWNEKLAFIFENVLGKKNIEIIHSILLGKMAVLRASLNEFYFSEEKKKENV